jgi:hypothetical protein
MSTFIKCSHHFILSRYLGGDAAANLTCRLFAGLAAVAAGMAVMAIVVVDGDATDDSYDDDSEILPSSIAR